MPMPPTLPLTRDLVLIGGGHTHALVLKMWGMRPLPGVRLTLIDPSPATAYTGMLPGFVAGHYDREALDIDLVRLARFAGARIILAPVTGLDPEARRIEIEGRAPIRYDFASLDVGATGRIPDIEGFAKHAVTAKPLSQFADRWQGYLDQIKEGSAPPKVAVIGAGAAGIELALAAHHRLSARGHTADVTLIEARDIIAPELSGSARRALRKALDRAQIKVRCGETVQRVEQTGVQLNGSFVDVDFVIGTVGVQAWDWVSDTGLSLTDEGWIRVGPTLQSLSHPNVFAAGDCAHYDHAPRPKAGVYAVRSAPVLMENLREALQARSPSRHFKPQRDYLKLISTGGKAAVAEKFGLAVHHKALWRLKDGIDAEFMDTLRDLQPMTPDRVGGPMADGVEALTRDAQPLCGGCGSKTGRDALQAGLEGLAAPLRSDVLHGRGDDAAILKHGERQQVITTDHLRSFVDDPSLFAEITAVHALGDIWACGAMPQAALATVILPPMSDQLQAAMVAEIMDAASRVFKDAGADIVGGHTSTGSELSIGFTVTGLTANAVRQGTANPGDGLVLTKPLGTGVVMAADMALKATGHEASACWTSMARPQAAAAGILSPVATAMTDVTGFGLAGHLAALLGDCHAKLDMDALPFLPGALRLAEAGVRSTLFQANQLPPETLAAPAGARGELLIDPQTAGGLLASVPADRLDSLKAAFEATGESVWVIGHVVEPEPGQSQITAS